jgi:hypothetical protein
MKKLIFVLSCLFSSLAFAQHPSHHGYHGYQAYHNRPYYSSGYWIAPAIVGGVIGYALAQPRVIYTPPPPVVVYPPVVNMPVPPMGYHYENVLDQNCNCYRLVLVPN